ncbi:MAG: lipoate--protein ligase family protein [Nanoarchaeota archaeon]|nr:lipoate--protein ligase family protein [Nanoarchaeota archaeon]MBU1004840.1 lipoate--protein ligase family protein [Nanoarchaeota archaeon]MBU1946778.1 lipoate--protein ligase family protein [Nanoarchaeota archaeon]
MKLRLIDTGFNTPSMNMAIDEALLTSKKPVLRFYRWKPAGLSIGYFQSTQAINVEGCKKRGVEIVRRLTGGNAVLHDKELTYSFIINEDEMPKSVVESYKMISKGLLQGLRNLKLKPEMNIDVKKEEKSAVCFKDPSWYELLVNRKKIVGSAQTRKNGKILQHGAVLIDIDVEKYCSLFNNCSEELIKKVKQRMTSINDELNKKVDYERVKKAMISGFEKELGIKFEASELIKEELKSAEELEKNKYSTDKWNYIR